jgi:Ca2+-binding RTX toxin-like protein
MPVVNDYTALLSGYQWYFGPPAGRALVLTYSFSAAPEQTLAGRPDVASLGFQPLDEDARALARQAMAMWSAVSGVTFLEVNQHEGDLTFGLYNLAALGMGGAAGTGSYPIVSAVRQSGRIRLYSNPLNDGGDIHIDAAYRAATTDADLLHVLLQQVGHTLGLKPPHVGNPTLQDDSGELSVMSYLPPRIATLGPLDVAAVQALYGAPTGAPGPETWSWDAASETYTATLTGDGQYLRGTWARDVLTALGNENAIVTLGGDDVVTIGGGPVEVDLGPGHDVLNVAMEFRPDRGMEISSFFIYLRINEGPVLHWYYGVEELNFTNGSYDMLARRFNFTLPAPEAPVFRHAWVDEAGQLAIAGTGTPGTEVRFDDLNPSRSVRATVAADGIWVATSLPPDPWLAAGHEIKVVTNREGQDSPAILFGTMDGGIPFDTSPSAPGSIRAFLVGGDGDDYLEGGEGDDLMHGGAGNDVAAIYRPLAEFRAGVAGDVVVLRSAMGTDTLVGVERLSSLEDEFVLTDVLAERAEPMMTRMFAGHPRYILADLYTGALPGLRYQLTGDGSAEILLGSTDGDLIDLGAGNDTLSGLAGNDVLAGGAGDDVIDGGEGIDTALFSGTRDQYRIGLMDGEVRVRGPDGNDTLRGIEQLQFGDTAPITVASLAGSPGTEELISLLVDGILQLQLPDEYAGPLDLRYVFTGTGGSDLATGTELNDFINLKEGDDAASAHGGDDIVDGGPGNNFLTGGAGRDTFFIDGRFGVPVWSCVTDWEPGEQLAIWGWQQGVSTFSWGEGGGLPGYLGATFHGDLDGNGLVETAVTVTGRSVAEMPGAVALSASGIGVLTFG